MQILALVVILAGCNSSVVVHLPTPMGYSADTTPHTAVLTASDAQALKIGGLALEQVASECTTGTVPGNFLVCMNGSRSCAKQANKPPVKGITVLYNCIMPEPPSGGGL